MANHSSYYHRNGKRTVKLSNQRLLFKSNEPALQYTSSLPSINSPEAGYFHGHSRDMRPPIPTPLPLPPQPMEIADLHISRTLPSLPTHGPGTLELLPPPGYGDISHGNPNIARIYQQFPDGQIIRPAQDPIQDWYSTNDGPWSHIPKVINLNPDGRFQSKQAGSRNHITSGGQYRLHNPSDSVSFHYGVPPPSDSGYASGTRRSVANTSVFSGDVPERDQDCHSLTGQVENFQPFIGAHEDMQQRDVRPFDTWTSVTSIQESRGLMCPTCRKPVKTQSEMKYDICHVQLG